METNESKRRDAYNKLLIHYHPDKNKNLHPELSASLMNYIIDNKDKFKNS